MPFPYLFPFYFENPSQAFVVWISGTDATNKTLIGANLSYSIGAVGTLNIVFESDAPVALGEWVNIYDTALNTFIFSGEIRELKRKQQTHNRYVYACVCHDWTRTISIVPNITGTFGGTEKAIITELIATYAPNWVIVGSGVITGIDTDLILNDNSLGEALDSLGATNSRVWWVDPTQELHYGSAADWGAGLFNFSDTPNFSTTYPYHDFEYTTDNISATTINQVQLKTYYSGLQVGTYVLLTNSVIGAPFTGATYYITDISARLLNTIDTNIRWEFTLTLRNSASLASIFTGYGSIDNFVSRLRNVPIPLGKYEPAPKRYVDTQTRGIGIIAIDSTDDVTVADGHAYIPIPAFMHGMNLTRAQAIVNTAGTTNPTTIDIYNVTDSVDMLSTAISIASGDTVGTVGVINTANDDVATNDILRIDVTTVSTTAPKGLLVILEFALP